MNTHLEPTNYRPMAPHSPHAVPDTARASRPWILGAAWLLLGGVLLWLVARLVQAPHLAALLVDDFVEYWAAGRLLLAGENPYAGPALLAVEQSAGWAKAVPLYMWNPPWTLAVTWPFALPPYGPARLAWLAVQTGAVVVSLDQLWRLYGGPVDRRWLALLLGFGFFPTLLVLSMGQITPLLLLGVTGFLVLVRRRRWAAAGALLLLVAIKPQLLYLFWSALFLWLAATPRRERQRLWVMGGGAVAGLAALLLVLACNPAVMAQYLQATAQQPPLYWITPTLGGLLRLWLGADRHWLQFAPMAVGMGWLALHWRRRGAAWSWEEEMPLLLLVSVGTTSFGWFYDQVILLPALVAVAAHQVRREDRRGIAHTLAALLLFSLLCLAVNLLHLGEIWYAWTAPLLLLLYLVEMQRR